MVTGRAGQGGKPPAARPPGSASRAGGRSRHSRATRAHLSSLKLQTVNALFAIYDAEIAARDAHDADLAGRLYQAREKLRLLVLEIRRAEAAHLKARRPLPEAEAVWAGAAGEMRALVRALRRQGRARPVGKDTAETAARAVTLLGDLTNRLK